jgi:protein subunit release factor B
MDRRNELRHASFMALDPKTLARLATLRIRPEDLEETFSRSSGPGGQHVNKVSTACSVRHVPTGLTVTASDSRSQSTNRQLALMRLLEMLEKQRAEKRQERLAGISKSRRQKAKRSRGTKRKLVEGKRKRGETKKLRGRVFS